MPKAQPDNNRRSTAVVVDHDLMKKNAKHPTITSGYDTVAVVQYADESDESYQKRVDDFESRKEHAENLRDYGVPNPTDEQKEEVDEAWKAENKARKQK
jgi:hypothetical protein